MHRFWIFGCYGQHPPCASMDFSRQEKSQFLLFTVLINRLIWHGQCCGRLPVPPEVSQADQLGNGVDVFMSSTEGLLCPVEAFLNYAALRGDRPGCFFVFVDGSSLTKPRFVAQVRQALQALGLPCDIFARHSFRIGAATAAARAGIEDSVIQMLGRWSSAAFLTYTRTPREQHARYSCLIFNYSIVLLI